MESNAVSREQKQVDVANSDTLGHEKDANQSNTSTPQKVLEGHEVTLRDKQKELSLGPELLINVSTEYVISHIEDLTGIRDYLVTLQINKRPGGNEKLESRQDAINSLNNAIADLSVAVRLCQRLDNHANDVGKDAADDMDTTTSHLFERIQKCQQPLNMAEGKIREFRNSLPKDEPPAADAGVNVAGGE